MRKPGTPSGKKSVTVAKIKQKPLRLDIAHKHDVRTQFGALCYRLHEGKVQILLITSRGTGRWIIPKGWPMDGETPAGAAATEAFEEAGVEGRLSNAVIGIYSYSKGMGKGDNMPCVVAIFPLKVKRLLKKYPEAGQRKRRWVSVKKAVQMVDEPELGNIIAAFDPKHLKPGSAQLH